jgi:hypothetical protein
MPITLASRSSVIAAALFLCSIARAAELRSLDVVGTHFKATLSDGRALDSTELVGATLTVAGAGGAMRIRIDAVEPDPGFDPSAGGPADVLLHSFSIEGPDGAWTHLCEPGPDGRRWGFPIPGRARGDGTIAPAEPGVFELTCAGGAQGKCVRFGYRPWEQRLGEPSAWSLYNACIRLVRADYSGDGKGTTRNGQPIEIVDAVGIRESGDDPAHDFEAGFSPEGAVCVRHVRVKENTSLEALEASVPRLKGRTGGICTEDYARALGAILFVRSPP